MSYKVAVKVYGEPQWNYNAQRFATREEAQGAAEDLSSRWMLVDKYEVQESTDPVNYMWSDGKATAVESPALEMPESELGVSPELEPELEVVSETIATEAPKVKRAKSKRKVTTFGDRSSMKGIF